jgi:phosphocarrier protein FPr
LGPFSCSKFLKTVSDNQLILLAPVSGVIYPLERVPDPVFSQKLAGDGISIDPTDNVLRAPCPGEILQRHAAGHAVTLKAAGGVEVLMHVGIDTVSLKGRGFTSRAQVGDKVDTGAPLIEFDLDYIATNAKSLLTEVIISNGEVVSATTYGSGTAVVGKTPVLTLTLNGAAAAAMPALRACEVPRGSVRTMRSLDQRAA